MNSQTLAAIAAAEDRARELGEREPPPICEMPPTPTGKEWLQCLLLLPLLGHEAMARAMDPRGRGLLT